MKKLAILLVAIMAMPLFAVTATWTDNGDGTGTLVLDATGDGENIVGLALNVDSAAALDIDSIAPANLNIYMDYAYDQEVNGDGWTYGEGDADASNAAADQAVAGPVALPAAAFCVSAGYLNGETTPGADGAATVTIVFSGESADIDLSENLARGGIVGVNGTDLALTGDVADLTISAGGCATCAGDFSGDNFVNTLDLQLLVNALGAAGSPFNIPSTDAAYNDCGDFSGDGFMNTLDLQLLVNYLGAAGSPFNVPCP